MDEEVSLSLLLLFGFVVCRRVFGEHCGSGYVVVVVLDRARHCGRVRFPPESCRRLRAPGTLLRRLFSCRAVQKYVYTYIHFQFRTEDVEAEAAVVPGAVLPGAALAVDAVIEVDAEVKEEKLSLSNKSVQALYNKE
jgi:hypothetical protein